MVETFFEITVKQTLSEFDTPPQLNFLLLKVSIM